MQDAAAKLQRIREGILTCRKCRLSETRLNPLAGEGDPDAELLLVAQAPGENEDREGRMFIGPSGRVLDGFLNRAGIGRDEIYMTNLLKCRLPRNRKPKRDEIRACAPFLEEEIQAVRPSVIVPMGYFATRYVLESRSIPLPESGRDFAQVFGRLALFRGGKVFPLPHPASALFDESSTEETAVEYEKLRVLQSPCKWFPVCPLKRYYEKGLVDEEWVDFYCGGDWESCKRYELEEKGVPHPDWMLPDGTVDESLAGE